MKVNSMEKAESLKNAIYQLYVNEGRSKSYISRLLEINRKTLGLKIQEWDFPEPNHLRHANPSTEKFIRKNRALIKSRLDSDVSVTEIAKELGVDRSRMRSVFYYDEVLKKANEDRMQRIHDAAQERIEGLKDKSRLDYYEGDLPGEEWKEILGYPDYMVLPPIEKRGVHHNNKVFYDPNRSYKEYAKDEKVKRFFAGEESIELL